MKKLSYREKFDVMDREARMTLVLAVIVTAAFWLAVLLLRNRSELLLGMPLWFTVSCIGGYLLSVAGVIFVVKRWFVDFDLGDDEEKEGRE
ncbi:MAG: YhdT family protein [Sutterellaceae bacterium]|nr:YhdT family protein [Sutterellaceae bacterium]MDD7443101.1 YhdT family protein [Sutterellaceae bacterium]MDY2868597.1 YhdT family protein [Mesosutterella sp.]